VACGSLRGPSRALSASPSSHSTTTEQKHSRPRGGEYKACANQVPRLSPPREIGLHPRKRI
jgi:hypothetical protein